MEIFGKSMLLGPKSPTHLSLFWQSGIENPTRHDGSYEILKAAKFRDFFIGALSNKVDFFGDNSRNIYRRY